MIKTEIVPDVGFENEFLNFMARKENLTIEIENEKQKAIAEVEARYADMNAKLDDLISRVSKQIEVEYPDEPIETIDAVAEEEFVGE